jgi:class 3 adenylate cyclase
VPNSDEPTVDRLADLQKTLAHSSLRADQTLPGTRAPAGTEPTLPTALPNGAGAVELEVVTDLQQNPNQSEVARRYERRVPLTVSVPLRLGRDSEMNVAIPEDIQLSRYQADLFWDPVAQRLTVTTRGPKLGFPNTPPNQTHTFDDQLKRLVPAPGGVCVIALGQSFWIGQTRFTVQERKGAVAGLPNLSPTEPFDPSNVFVSTRNLLVSMSTAKTEAGLLKSLVRAVGEEMPRVDGVAILSLPAGRPSASDVNVSHQWARPDTKFATNGFNPSAELAVHAANQRRACHVLWKNESNPALDRPLDEDTVTDMPVVRTPWAAVAPFQGSSTYLLYIAGHAQGPWKLLGEAVQQRIEDEIKQCLLTAELLVGACETTLRALRGEQQVRAIRRAWPQGLWHLLEDPDELERMLAPKEMEITTLFCDLRNYSLFACQNAGDLLAAQTNVSGKLSVMSGAITDRGGVVGGFRGDAVLGFWGWPKPDARNIEHAARAALNIEGRLNEWTRKNRRCGVAITHGTAVAGRLGAHDLAVVDLYGPVVNLTFRLEAMTKAFEVPIIVNEAIAKRLEELDPDSKQFVTRPLGKVRAKGFPESVWAYELYSPQHAPFNAHVRAEWARAVEAFSVGNWAEAAKQLRDVFDEDSVAKCLLRCIDATNGKPPDDWDGSFAPTEPPAKG